MKNGLCSFHMKLLDGTYEPATLSFAAARYDAVVLSRIIRVRILSKRAVYRVLIINPPRAQRPLVK